jgi:hypothetical protein
VVGDQEANRLTVAQQAETTIIMEETVAHPYKSHSKVSKVSEKISPFIYNVLNSLYIFKSL